ncbi:MAG: zinc ribbon domain-containing protein [Eubacteriales bacterium]|nr:zinc ribbon domain-containing protein [Eubacteriales bacterium]
MYCEQCGALLEPESRFCGRCGSSVTQPPVGSAHEHISPEPLNQYSGSEEVMWVFSAQRKESLFKRTPAYIILLKDKLLVAHLPAQLQKQESSRVSGEIKAEGKGFFKGSAAMMQFWANYQNKYYSMTSGQILAEDPTNFVIPYVNIKKLVYQCESSSIDDDGRSYGHQGKLDISLLDGNKIDFSHSISHDKTIKQTLTELFGDTLKYKK